jgi:hypothetical protein
VGRQYVSQGKVLATDPLNISFRRTLQGSKLTDWSNFVTQISSFSLVDGSNTFRWNLTYSVLFSVRSMYLHLLDSHPPFRHKKSGSLKFL